MGETTTVAPTIADEVKQQVISALDWVGTRTGQHEKNYSREAFASHVVVFSRSEAAQS